MMMIVDSTVAAAAVAASVWFAAVEDPHSNRLMM
jgi:hypothetical protein